MDRSKKGEKMYLSEIKLKNFRCFDQADHSIRFHSGLNVIVGENDSGKSAVIDAIRIVLGTTDQSWYRIEETDFYQEDIAREITISCCFEELNDDEYAAFLECLTYKEQNSKHIPKLFLFWKCKYLPNLTPRRFLATLHTGESGDGKSPSPEARELFRVTYLRALRDAYSDMQSGRHSRLSQILQNVSDLNIGTTEYSEGTKLNDLSLTGIFDLSNKLISNHSSLEKTNQNINGILKNQMLLNGNLLETKFQVAGLDALENKKLVSLLEKIDLTVVHSDKKSHGRVGFGTSNIISMACEMILNSTNFENGRSSFLLIEEPEAHIHAQRQLRLIQSLQNEASHKSHQIIVTTHSPLLTSVVDLENISILCQGKAFSLAKGQTLLSDEDYSYLSRYLDATKANLFFAKGVLIVEGPAEELLLPTIARIIKRDFSKYGVSIVNVRGIGLRRFARIFQRKDDSSQLPIPVACVADRDIMPDCAPAILLNYSSIDKYPPQNKRKWRTESELSETEKEEHVKNIKDKADDQKVKTFVSEHWTLEYDMFYSGLQEEMQDTLVKVLYAEQNQQKKLDELNTNINKQPSKEKQATVFYEFFFNKTVSKAVFAQTLASKLLNSYSENPDELISKLPSYLIEAIEYVTEKLGCK